MSETDPHINYGLATYNVGPKDRSIASMSGASQQLMPANPLRKSFFVENDGANVIYITWTKATAAADAVGVFELAIGASVGSRIPSEDVPKGAIFVLGTAGQPVYAEETFGIPERAS